MDLVDITALVILISIIAMVLALGLRSAAGEALYMLRHPGLLARSVVAMYLVVPLLMVALVELFDLRPEVEIALVALSLSPVPPFLPDKELKIVTHERYVYGLLIAASIAAIALVPLAMWLLEARLGLDSPMTAAQVFVTVSATVLAPLALGMIARHLWPAFAARTSSRLNAVGVALLAVASVVEAATQLPELLSLIGGGTVIAFAVFTVLGLAAGHVLGGPRPDERTVLALASASRHPAVAIGIVVAAFPDAELAPTAVVLATIVSAIVAAPYAAWRKRVHLEHAHT